MRNAAFATNLAAGMWLTVLVTGVTVLIISGIGGVLKQRGAGRFSPVSRAILARLYPRGE